MNEEMIEDVMKLPEENVTVNGVEGTIKQQEQYSPEDVAAAFFRMNRNKFEELLGKMAPYQIRRAVMNAVSYPFVDEEYNPSDNDERQFAYLVHELMMNKSMMMMAGEMLKVAEDVSKHDTNAKKAQETNNIKEEVENGSME